MGFCKGNRWLGITTKLVDAEFLFISFWLMSLSFTFIIRNYDVHFDIEWSIRFYRWFPAKSKKISNKKEALTDEEKLKLAVDSLEKLSDEWLYWPASRQPVPKVKAYESRTINDIEKMAQDTIKLIKGR